MSFVKYRLKEVAADFGVTPKEISEIVAKFYDKPKSNTQVLNDAELNAVFDYDPEEPDQLHRAGLCCEGHCTQG